MTYRYRRLRTHFETLAARPGRTAEGRRIVKAVGLVGQRVRMASE